MVAIAIVAAVGWFALYFGCMAATSNRRLRRRMRRYRLDGGPPDLGDPALVNLVTTGCQLNAAAFAATILHLGGRGILALSEPEPGQLWCEPTPEGAGDLDLAEHERLVLDAVTRQFAEAGGAPFEALADICLADVKGIWDPFEKAVRAEGRRRGLTRARLPSAATFLLYYGAGAVAALAAGGITGLPPHSRDWAVPLVVALITLVVLASLTGVLARRDRLAPAGAALAAWAARAAAQQPPPGIAEPGRLALAVATDGGPPVPGLEHIRRGDVRQGGHHGSMATVANPDRPGRAPKQAWSSRDGQWRLVPVGPRRESPRGVAGGLVAGSAVTFLAALGSYAGYHTLQASAVWALVPAGLLAGSAALAVAGVRAVARWLALPTEVSFTGQVIARWIEEESGGGENSSTVTFWCLALDDGQRAWTFDVGQAAFGQFPLGARIRARIAPRSMRLLDLAMAGPEGEILPGQPRWGESAGSGPGPWGTRPRASVTTAADAPACAGPRAARPPGHRGRHRSRARLRCPVPRHADPVRHHIPGQWGDHQFHHHEQARR